MLFWWVMGLSMPVIAQSGTERVTLNLTNATMETFVNQVTAQTGYKFFYGGDMAEGIEPITINVQGVALKAVLDEVLGKKGYSYTLEDKTVVIQEAKKKALPQATEERKITGIAKDEDGLPLPGVTVLIKGTTVGTATDVDGAFTLRVPDMPDLTLVFSFVGMETKEVKVGDQTNLNVVMALSQESLDEVVVTGIFERKAESFTGASVSMSQEDLKSVGNQNVFQSLKSLDPSLMIFDNMEFGSDPNQNPRMTLRGSSSLDLSSTDDIDIKGTYANDPNTPLFILDGFEASVEKIMDLDMDRVASLTILKDASAKAIYGSKAANGVIVIETKRSTTGDLRVTYSGNVNIEAPDLSSYNLTNAAQKLELERDFGLYDGETIEEDIELKRRYYQKYKSVVAGVDTDWLAKPLRNAVGHKHSLSIELGSQDLQVLADFSYNNIQGVMKGSSRTTYDGAIQVSYRHKKFNFRNSLNVVSNVASDSPYGTFSEYAYMNPYYSPYDANGLLVENAALSVDGLEESGGEFVANPLYNASLNTKIEERYLDVTNNLYVEWMVLQGLRATLRFGITEKRTSADEFYPSNHLMFYDYSADDFFRKGSYQVNNGHLKKLSGDLNVRYSTQIKEKNWDIFGFDNEKQKDRLNWFSLEEFYLTIQKRMWENKTILIEYPFYQRHKPKLQELLESGREYDEVLAIGPIPMMKFVSKTTEPFGVKTIVSLNPIMVDGTGMCGGCRVTVGGEVKFACVDGPDFDGHKVDFAELMNRNGVYRDREAETNKTHMCRLEKLGKELIK